LRAAFVLCGCIVGGAALVLVGLALSVWLSALGTILIAFGPLAVAVRAALAPPRRAGLGAAGATSGRSAATPMHKSVEPRRPAPR
jgi:hypothetical protein